MSSSTLRRQWGIVDSSSGGISGCMHAGRRRLVFPDDDGPTTPREAGTRSPLPATTRLTTPTRSAVTPRRGSAAAAASTAALPLVPATAQEPSEMEGVTSSSYQRPAPASQRTLTTTSLNPPGSTGGGLQASSRQRFSPTPSSRRSSSTPAGPSQGGRSTTIPIAPPAPHLPAALTTPRGSTTRPLGSIHKAHAAALSSLSVPASGEGRSGLSAAVAYSAPPARAVECVYFDVVQSRCFDGLFRSAAAVVTRTAPALSAHVCPAGEPAAGVGKEEEERGDDSSAQGPAAAGAADDDGSRETLAHEELPEELPRSPPRLHSSPSSARHAIAGRWLSSSGPHPAMRHRGADNAPSPAPSVASRAAGHSRARGGGLGHGSGGSSSSSARGRQSARSTGRSSTGAFTPRRTRAGLPAASTAGTAPRHEAVKHNQTKLNRDLDMHSLHSGGLHTSFWLAGQDGSIEVRSLENPNVIMSVLPAKRASRAIVTTLVQPCANVVVAGLSDGYLRAFDAAALTQLAEVRAHAAAITCVTCASVPLPSNEPLPSKTRVLATGSSDWTIGLWHASTLEPIGRLQGNRNGVTCLCAAANGCFLFSGGDDGTLRAWNVLEGGAVELGKDERRSLQNAVHAARIHHRRGSRMTVNTDETHKLTGPVCHNGGDSAARRGAGEGADGTKSAAAGTKKKAGAAGELSSALRRAEAFVAAYQTATSMHDVTPLLTGRGGGTAIATPTTTSSSSPWSTDPLFFNWPIEAAHRESVSGVVLVEEQWLVSVSRDTAAKVYGLPNGALVRSLVMQRKMPLTGVLYDPAQRRLLIGGADGTVLAFDMTSPEMDLVMQVRPPTLSFSSLFAPIDRRSLSRFFLCTGGTFAGVPSASRAGRAPAGTAEAGTTSSGGMGVLSVSAFDKTTLAHGPGRTFTTYRVGEPSLRELNGSMQLSKLHAQVLENQATRDRVRAMGTDEEMELRDGRRCARTLNLWHARRFLSHYFEGWRRLAARRSLRDGHAVNATSLHSVVVEALARDYFVKWHRFCQLIRLQTHRDTVAALQCRAQSPLAGPARRPCLTRTLAQHDAVVGRTRQSRTRLIASLADAQGKRLLWRFFSGWIAATQARRAEERRDVAANRLLLSFSGPRYSSMRCIWQATVRQALHAARLRRASALLAQQQDCITTPRLQRIYWAKWAAAAREMKRQRAREEQQNAWQLVEPLSTTLIRPHLLRTRCFSLWRDYAVHVSKNARLAEEKRTMQREFLSLQDALDNPSTLEQLRVEEAELETAIAHTAFERDAMGVKAKVLRQEVTSLRMAEALKVLLTGFSSEGAPGAVCSAGSSIAPDEDDTCASSAPSSTTSALLQRLKSVMNAIKGTALQYARDEKQVVAAYNFALHIPIIDPSSPLLQHRPEHAPQLHQHSNSHDLSASCGSLGSGGGGRLGGQHRHPLSHSGNLGGTNSGNWSVTVTRTGSAGAARRPSTTAHLANRAGYSPRIAGSGHAVGAPHTSEAVVNAKRYASLAAAFDATTQQLHAVLCTAAREAGVDLEGTNGLLILPSATEVREGRPSSSSFSVPAVRRESKAVAVNDDDGEVEARGAAPAPEPQPRAWTPRVGGVRPANGAGASSGVASTPLKLDRAAPQRNPREHSSSGGTQTSAADSLQESLRWLRFVSAKTRKDVMGLALQLVVLYDSFAAHSEMSVEAGGAGLSTRGAAVVRALPLPSLCNEATAILLIRHAAALLELLQPRLWESQTRLVDIAEGQLKGDAVSVAVVEPNAPAVSAAAPPADPAAISRHPSASGCAGRARAVRESSERSNADVPQPFPGSVDEGGVGDSALLRSSGARSEGASRAPRPPPVDGRKPQLRLSTAMLARPGKPRGDNGVVSGAIPAPGPAGTTRPHNSAEASFASLQLPLPYPYPEGSVDRTGGGGSISGYRMSGGGANTSLESGSGAVAEENDDFALGQSMRSQSGASTPRSLTSRSFTPRSLTPRSAAAVAATFSATVAGTVRLKPFLGFRVNVQRESGSRSVLTVKEIVPSYVGASGEMEVGPALLAGMAVGDELVRFAGYTVTDLAAFNAIVSRHVKPGVDMPVTLLRGGERVDTKIHVGLKTNVM